MKYLHKDHLQLQLKVISVLLDRDKVNPSIALGSHVFGGDGVRTETCNGENYNYAIIARFCPHGNHT